MTDAERIKNGGSLALFEDLKRDRPEKIKRRLFALDTTDFDRLESELGDDRMYELLQMTTTQKVVDSLMKKSDEEMTDEDWADLRAADY